MSSRTDGWSRSPNGTQGLRDLCFELFERRSTRALRSVMSGAFGQRVLPTGDVDTGR
jgi:hypothetical protein